jgi:hypothetical protein
VEIFSAKPGNHGFEIINQRLVPLTLFAVFSVSAARGDLETGWPLFFFFFSNWFRGPLFLGRSSA